MAEVLSKSGLISSFNSGIQHHRRGISVAPRSCSYNSGVSCAAKKFPSLKLKYKAVRSSQCSYV